MARLQSQVKTKRFGWVAALTVLALGAGLFGLSLHTPATATIAGSGFDASDGVPDTEGGTRSLVTVADKPSGSSDDTYAGDGAAEPALCPAVDLTHAAPQKSDIQSFSYGTDSAAPGVLYLAWTRKFAGGTLAVDFEFNQGATGCGNGVNPVRQDGDLMVVYEFDGGTVQDVQVRTWTAGAWSSPVTPVPAVAAEAEISADQLFGELSIDLTHSAFKIFDPDDCKAFTTGWAKSRTGNSFTTSKVKDFVAPRTVTVSNCGSLKVVKDAQPDAADDFGFTASGNSGTYASDVPGSFVLDDDADATRSNTRQIIAHPQTVTVTEDAAAGWQLTDISCTGAGASKVTRSTATRALSVALATTDDITCTFVNAKPNTLTVVKDAAPDNGRDFAFTGSGTGVALTFSLDDDADATLSNQASFPNLAAGTYTVTEGAATGWSLTAISCSGATVGYQAADGTPAASTTWASGHDRASVTLTAGQSPTCTFTNTKTLPSIETTKTATPTSVAEPGGSVRFDVAVKNTSPLNVAITDLSDDVYGDITALNAPTGGTKCALGAVLAPNATYSCSFVAPVAGNAGDTHEDTVSATAVDTDGVSDTDTDDATVAITDVLPELAVTKTPSATLVHKGDTVTYTYVVTNKGIEQVALTTADDKCSPITGPLTGEDKDADGKLDPDETWTLSCSSALTTTTKNVITATGTDDEGNTSIKKADATVTVLDPAIKVTKAASAPTVHVGDPVTYTYEVTNTGTATPLTNVTIGDDKCAAITGPTGDGAPVGTLSTGETWVYTCTSTLLADTTNVVTVTGKDALNKVVTNTANATVAVLDPKIDVVKTPSAPVVHAGDSVTYTYVVTNPTTTPLATVTVVDDKCSMVAGPAAGGDADGDGKLDKGESWTYACTSVLTATTTNVATAKGVDALGKEASATATATVVVITPAIAIDKAPSARSVSPGTTVVYTYTVTNPGDVPLTAVAVTDDKCSPVALVSGDANGDGILQVAETWTFTCSQVQTGSLDTLTNVGTAIGTDPLGLVVKSTDTVTVAVVAPLVIAQPTPQAVVVPAPTPAPAGTAPVTLPRTGIDVNGWIQLGASLVLLGVSLLITARNRRRTA